MSAHLTLPVYSADLATCRAWLEAALLEEVVDVYDRWARNRANVLETTDLYGYPQTEADARRLYPEPGLSVSYLASEVLQRYLPDGLRYVVRRRLVGYVRTGLERLVRDGRLERSTGCGRYGSRGCHVYGPTTLARDELEGVIAEANELSRAAAAELEGELEADLAG